jgi:CBS domain-containing protein
MRVQDVMTDSPRACTVHDTANAAARIMWEQDCGAVPVVGDDGRVAGIVTDRDICMAAYFDGAPLSAIPVAKIMSPDVCTCRAEDELTKAERLMRERQVNRLPVVQDGQMLVGILSLCDVTQGIKRNGGLRQKGQEGQDLLETVAAIKEPRSPRSVAS